MIVKLAKARALGETRRRRVVRRLTQPVGVCLRVKCATDSWSFHGRRIKASSWRGCNTCVGTVTIFSRDAHDFRKHAQSKQHNNAVKSKSLALEMQQAQNKAVVKRIAQQIDDTGKLLIIMGFMIATGISLRRFPQVCSKQFKITV
jgi:hypothetical protein